MRKEESEPQPTVIIRERTIIIERESRYEPIKESSTVDGGEIHAEKPSRPDADRPRLVDSSQRALVDSRREARPAKRASTLGAIRALHRIEDVQSRRLLTYEPARSDQDATPDSKSEPTVKPKVNIAALIRASQKKG